MTHYEREHEPLAPLPHFMRRLVLSWLGFAPVAHRLLHPFHLDQEEDQ